MTDLTAEQVKQFAAFLVDHDMQLRGFTRDAIAEILTGYADALAEGRVLPPLPEGERRIVLTTVDGEWPEGTEDGLAFAIGQKVRLDDQGVRENPLQLHDAAKAVLDALAGEA